MSTSNRIQEIYWLRFNGCLLVFCFHLLDRLEKQTDSIALNLARIPTVLGTPTFIFISIFLFSLRYGGRLPSGFLGDRARYLLVPYVAYGLFYALSEIVYENGRGNNEPVVGTLVEYLLYAGWHGYFLIIAVQFYALYWLYARFDLGRHLNARTGLTLATLVSISYWWLTNRMDEPLPGYLIWIAPFGWIYLFFLALLLVRAYRGGDGTMPMHWLSNPLWLTLTFVALALATFSDMPIAFSSKETWVVPLFILFAMTTMRLLRGVPAPPLVKRINEHSFGIYLAHPLFFGVVEALGRKVSFNLLEYTLLLFITGLFGSIALNVAANQSDWGGLVLGKRLRAP